MALIRWVVGKILLTVNWMSFPRMGERSLEDQDLVNQQLRNYALYQFTACPFCIKVRRNLQRLSLPVEIRDAKLDPKSRQELLEGGGRLKVPCLRIEEGEQVQWMYESDDIVAHLKQKFPLL